MPIFAGTTADVPVALGHGETNDHGGTFRRQPTVDVSAFLVDIGRQVRIHGGAQPLPGRIEIGWVHSHSAAMEISEGRPVAGGRGGGSDTVAEAALEGDDAIDELVDPQIEFGNSASWHIKDVAGKNAGIGNVLPSRRPRTSTRRNIARPSGARRIRITSSRRAVSMAPEASCRAPITVAGPVIC